MFANVPKVPVIVPTLDVFSRIIQNTPYIQNCKQNVKKDVHSISYLLDTDVLKRMSQSDCIKLGNGLEHFFKNIIIEAAPNLKNIKPAKTPRGEKEMDHLFEDPAKKVIYYAELKSNLNLDTEKCKATVKKCRDIETILRNKYPEHTIEMCLVGCRYLNIATELGDTDARVYAKYEEIRNNLCGVNDYFAKLGIQHMCFINMEQYRAVLNIVVHEMFKLDNNTDKITLKNAAASDDCDDNNSVYSDNYSVGSNKSV